MNHIFYIWKDQDFKGYSRLDVFDVVIVGFQYFFSSSITTYIFLPYGTNCLFFFMNMEIWLHYRCMCWLILDV